MFKHSSPEFPESTEKAVRAIFGRRLFAILLFVGVHIVALAASYATAYALRFDFAVPPHYRDVLLQSLAVVVMTKLAVFYLLGIFTSGWRSVSFDDLVRLVCVATAATMATALVDYIFLPNPIPRGVLAADLGGTVLLVGGIRALWRFGLENIWPSLAMQDRKPVLLIAKSPDGERIVREIHHKKLLNLRVVGSLQDRPSAAKRFSGAPCLGTPEDLVHVAARRNIKQVLVVSGSVSATRLRTLVDRCRRANIDLKMLPDVSDMLAGAFQVRIRDVDINDLLRRESVALDSASIGEMLHGQTVLVTGAGGSIGSEICRDVLQSQPATLILVERAENNLFEIDREINQVAHTRVIPLLADIGNQPDMDSIFAQYRPDIVFHAAAHKHVPLMERNPGQAVANNVLGTKNVADLAAAYGAKRFVMISTDKAVNPTSVMGATKHLAERYVHACSENTTTKFVVVRFGNVLASSGSVVPIFQEQIRRGGPVTVTDSRMERYFMTIPEACRLVLQAAAQGRGGEIFVLDMGQPVRILDLARDLIYLSGLSTDEIEIQIVGCRPGEKNAEELYQSDERMLETVHPRIKAAHHRPFSKEEVDHVIQELSTVINESPQRVIEKLSQLIDEYKPHKLTVAAHVDPVEAHAITS